MAYTLKNAKTGEVITSSGSKNKFTSEDYTNRRTVSSPSGKYTLTRIKETKYTGRPSPYFPAENQNADKSSVQKSTPRKTTDNFPNISALGAGNYGADKRPNEGYNYGKGLLKAGGMGLTAIARTPTTILAQGERLAAKGWNALFGNIAPMNERGLFNLADEAVARDQEYVQQKYAENTEKGGKYAAKAEELGASAVEALASLAAAYVSGGASAALTADKLAAQTASKSAPAIVQTLQQVVKSRAKDPNYLTSAAQIYSHSYNDAKAEGVDEKKATLYALGNALLGSEIEISGGIQNLPNSVGNQAAWRTLVDTMIDEGKEEVLQGIIDRTLQNVVYGADNPYFGVNENAIFDPGTAAEEFAGGAIVGGLLSGGTMGVNALANRAAYGAARAQYNRDVRQNTAPEMDSKAAEAVEVVTRGEPITGNQAAAIARDPVAVEMLEQRTGVNLDTEQPLSALKKDIQAVSTRSTARETQAASTPTPTAQKRTQRTIGGFMEAGQKAYQTLRQTAENEADLYAGFSSMYNAGLNGIEASKAKGRYADLLTPEQRYAAYNAGLEDAAAQVAQENAEVASVTTTAGAGLADNEYSRYIIAKDKGSASTLNTIGKKLGVRIEFVDSIMDGQANGQYIREKNLIQIAADSTNPIYEVAGHEITHRMQDLSPDEYRAFRQAAMEYRMRENGADTETEVVQRYMEAAERAGVTLTQDKVMDEIAADFAGRMIEDTDLFAQFARDNRTAAQKLLDGLKEFIAKVKAMFTGKARDNAAMDAYGKTFGELEDIAQKWQAAFDAAEKQAEKAKTAAGEGSGRMMLKDYSYDALVRKPDMTLAVVEDADGLSRKEVIDKALTEAKKYGGVNQNGNVYVHVNDTDTDVVISTKALRHGLDRRFAVNAPATLKVGEILQNAVRVNELVPKLDTVDATYVLMGAAKNKNNEPYIVQFVVNRASNEVMSVDVLYAINAKTEPAGSLSPEITGVPATLTGSNISIADLLAYVNRYFPDVLPESVLRHFGHSERPAGKLGEGALFSLKAYSEAEKKDHVKSAKEFFGKTYSWNETGYITTDGTKLDFSGRHDGGPGGYRTVDHRDIRDALGLDYGGEDYSGAMVQFMGEGNIRISPESGGINLSVMPTKAQLDTLADFISKNRGEVILDLDDTNGNTVSSTEYPRGTHSSKVINDIKAYFETGTMPQVSELGKFRYQLKGTDSVGRQLSEQQREYFKDSKVRDAEGNLRPMYRGGTGSFTVFDRKKSKSSNLYGRGFYFTDSKTHAGQYGDVREFYLNITNPVSTTETTITKAQMRRFLAAVAENEDDFSFENYGYGATVDSVLRSLYGKSDFLMLNDVSQTAIGDMVAAVELFNEVNGTSYDGLIMDTETVAFRSEQIKNVDNLNPTGDPDIRFQLKSATDIEQEMRDLKRERTALASRNRALEQRVQELKGEMRISKEPSVVARDVKKLGQSLIREYGSDVKYADVQSEMDALAKAVMKRDVTMENLMPHAKAVAEAIVGNTSELTEYGAELLEIRDYLKRQTIQFNGDMANYGDFRKSHMGTLKLNKNNGAAVDTVYGELTEMFGEGYFPSDVYTEADKLLQIGDVLDGLDSVYHNPFEGYRDAAVQEIANQLVDDMISDQVRQKKTYADRRALEKQEAVGRVREMLSRERQKRRDDVNALRKTYNEKTKKGNEKRKATAMRARIARHTGAISRKLVNPTDKQHIPERLRVTVASLLQNINLESAYSYDENGRLRKNADGDPTRRTLEADRLKQIYDDILDNEGNMVVDPALTESGGLLDSLSALGGKRIADMNVSELETVWNAIRAIETTLTTYDKTLSSAKYKSTSEWAERFAADSVGRQRRNRKISLDMADPYTFFSAYGDAGKQVYRTLRNAQDQQHWMLTEVQREAEKFLDKNVYKNRFDRHTFTTGRGVELTLTTDQIMNLYNLARRGEQAMHHLTVGGIVQPEIQRNGKLKAIPRGNDNILLTEEDIKAITSVLTPEQVKVANGLQKLASTNLAEWGNNASMQVYGYRKFKEEHYWPIKAAKDAVASSVEKDADNARSIKNMGSAKALTPNASNALDIGGAYDVFAQNASDMIKYATLLAPMEDINRLYNYRYRDSSGNLTGRNMQQVLSGVYGDAAQKYWRNLMRDMQNGMVKNASDTTRAIERIVGNTKGAAVGANWRVVIQQPTAFFRAAVILDPENMAKGIARGVTDGNGWDKARKWAAIAGIKDSSGFDQGSRYTIAREVYGSSDSFMDKLSDWSSRGAANADAITWGKIWNACEWQVAADKKTEVGSDAYYRQVAELFTDVIDQTQVVDGIMQRTQIMRDSDALTRQATSFMGEPLKSLNILMRSYDAWRFETNTQKRSAALKQLKRSVGALLVTDVINSLAQSLVDALRDDDKEKKYWARFFAALTGVSGDEESFGELAKNVLLEGNLKDNITLLGRLPYAKDLISILQGYSVERMDADAIGDIVRATQTMYNSVNGKGSKTTAYATKQLFTAVSKIFGVSLANLGRDVWALARSIANETDNVRIMFEMEKAIYRMDRSAGNKKRWCALLYRAQKENDTETARLIYKEMLEHGYDEEDVRQGIETIMKKEQGVGPVKELKNRWRAP